MEKLKYISTERYMEGIIVEVTDGSVAIDFKGRLGYMRLPLRMVISDYDLKVGMIVGFMMSFPEVMSDAVDSEYINKKRAIIKEANNESYNS
ncbi:MAG: hypothetical protein CR988_05595 [Treponema sp.]|nr:MAG: hypothetical protein CR988_05595 [Treponema sp.]